MNTVFSLFSLFQQCVIVFCVRVLHFFVKIFPKYFILFDAVNGIVFLILFSDYLLLCKKSVGYWSYILLPYWTCSLPFNASLLLSYFFLLFFHLLESMHVWSFRFRFGFFFFNFIHFPLITILATDILVYYNCGLFLIQHWFIFNPIMFYSFQVFWWLLFCSWYLV